VVDFLDDGKLWYHFLALFNLEEICPQFVQDFSVCGHNESRIICPCSTCNRNNLFVHMAAHQSSCIVIMHNYAAFKSYWCDFGANSRELSVL